jgi:Zn-dependent protease with chaperone function
MEVGASASTLFIADPFRSVSEKRRKEMRFSSMFSTHPPIAERIDRLTQMASPLS